MPWPRCSPARSADPFAAEVVAVPAKGVERWLAQRLVAPARRPRRRRHLRGGGVPLPAALVAESISGAVGGAPDDDPWHPERAVWPLLEVLDAAADEPWWRRARHAHHAAGTPSARRSGGAVQRLRHPPARACCGPGGRARCGCDADLALAARAVAAAARRIGGRIPPSGSTRRRGPARRSRRRRAARAAVALRAHPPRRAGARGARRAGRAPGGPPVAPPPLARALGHGCRPGRRVPPRAADPSADAAAHRCCPRSGAMCASCRCGSPPPCPASSTSTTPAPSRRPRCWAGCSGELRDDRPLAG